MKKIAEFVLKKRLIVLMLIGALTIFFSFFIPRLKINPDVLNYLPKDDPVTMTFDSIGDAYQGNMIALIGYSCDNVFSAEALKEVSALTDSISTMQGVSAVTSIINIIDARNVDSVLQVVPLIDKDNIPTDAQVLDSIKRYVLSKEIYRGFFVSEDAKATLITYRIQPDFVEAIDSTIKKDSVLHYYQQKYKAPIYTISLNKTKDSIAVKVDKTVVSNMVRDNLNQWKLKGKLYFGGLPYMVSDIGAIISHDIVTLGILAFIIILIVLYLSFKSWRGVVMPVLAVAIAIDWVLGIMGIFGFEITMVTNVTPVILLATGSAYTIHVINRIQEEVLNGEHTLNYLIVKAMAYVSIPVFFAALTTVIGFVSFIFGSYLVMISQFGIFTALGVFFSFILAITFVPAFLSYFPFKKKMAEHHELSQKSPLNKALKWISHINSKRKISVVVTWVVIIAFFVVGLFKIERRVDLLDYFKENYPSKKTENFLREKFGGTSYMFLNFKGNVQDYKTLQLMDTVQNYVSSMPEISHSLSVVNILKEMNDVMGEGKQLPSSQEKVYNLWFLLEGQETMNQIVANGNTEGLIQATLKTTDSKKMSALVDDLDKYLQKHHLDSCSIRQSGFPSIYKRIDESLVSSQLYSLVIALFLVYFLVSYLLKSLKNGLFAIIPIVSTVITLFGTMGWLHIPLDVATVLVASVTMGIGIDYAIHFISHVTHAQQNGTSLSKAIEGATLTSGRAIIINVLSVTLGFLVLLFSDLVPLQRFGLLIGVTMITSGLSTLTLLAAVMNLKTKN